MCYGDTGPQLSAIPHGEQCERQLLHALGFAQIHIPSRTTFMCVVLNLYEACIEKVKVALNREEGHVYLSLTGQCPLVRPAGVGEDDE